MNLEEYNIYDEEYISCISELLENSSVQSMRKYIQHGSTTTFDHCVAVSYESYKIAKKMGMDYKSVARAGLLHDLFLYDWHLNTEKKPLFQKHGFTHPERALKNATELFNLNELEKDIISKHMWPLTLTHVPKYKESFIVSLVDKHRSTIETFEPLTTKFSNIFSKNTF